MRWLNYILIRKGSLALMLSFPMKMARMGRAEEKRWKVARPGQRYWVAWYWLASRLVPGIGI